MTDEFVHKLVLHSAPMDTADGSLSVLNQIMHPDKSPFLTWEENHEELLKTNSRQTSINRHGEESVGLAEALYYPGRSKDENASGTMSTIAFLPSAAAAILCMLC